MSSTDGKCGDNYSDTGREEERSGVNNADDESGSPAAEVCNRGGTMTAPSYFSSPATATEPSSSGRVVDSDADRRARGGIDAVGANAGPAAPARPARRRVEERRAPDGSRVVTTEETWPDGSRLISREFSPPRFERFHADAGTAGNGIGDAVDSKLAGTFKTRDIPTEEGSHRSLEKRARHSAAAAVHEPAQPTSPPPADAVPEFHASAGLPSSEAGPKTGSNRGARNPYRRRGHSMPPTGQDPCLPTAYPPAQAGVVEGDSRARQARLNSTTIPADSAVAKIGARDANTGQVEETLAKKIAFGGPEIYADDDGPHPSTNARARHEIKRAGHVATAGAAADQPILARNGSLPAGPELSPVQDRYSEAGAQRAAAAGGADAEPAVAKVGRKLPPGPELSPVQDRYPEAGAQRAAAGVGAECAVGKAGRKLPPRPELSPVEDRYPEAGAQGADAERAVVRAGELPPGPEVSADPDREPPRAGDVLDRTGRGRIVAGGMETMPHPRDAPSNFPSDPAEREDLFITVEAFPVTAEQNRECVPAEERASNNRPPLPIAVARKDVWGVNFRNRRVRVFLILAASIVIALAMGLGLSKPVKSVHTTAPSFAFPTPVPTALSWTEVGQAINGDTPYDYFGSSVSISDDGTRVAISARLGGYVKVYRNTLSGSWFLFGGGFISQEGLVPRVALSGDGNRIATYEVSDGFEELKVFEYFSVPYGLWSQIGGTISVGGYGFGLSVSQNQNGTVVAVGPPCHLSGVEKTVVWEVKVFANTAGNWTQLGTGIKGEAGQGASGEAVSLSADGQTVAIGAPGNDGNSTRNRGHARVYSYQSGSWIQLGQDLDNEEAADKFGRAVALSFDGRIVAVGAQDDRNASNIRGHVRIYQYHSASDFWSQMGSNIDGEVESISMSANGDKVAVGAPKSGLVRIFEFDGTSWEQIAGDINGGGLFGTSVSLTADGSRVAVGAPRISLNGEWSGQVGVFELQVL